MALHAVVLKDPAILFLDHDRLLKFLRRESLGVVIAVLGLGNIFGNKGVGKVAIDAAGNSMVAGLLP